MALLSPVQLAMAAVTTALVSAACGATAEGDVPSSLAEASPQAVHSDSLQKVFPPCPGGSSCSSSTSPAVGNPGGGETTGSAPGEAERKRPSAPAIGAGTREHTPARAEEVAEPPRPRRGISPESGTLPLAIIQRSFPDLGFPAHGSISVGTVVDGFIVQGRELPLVGADAAVYPDCRGRGTNWGTDEIVSLIEKAAAAVARKYPGSTLQVANIARGGGGPLPWSISHEAGRDADLGFYMVDDLGNQVLLPAMAELSPPLGETTVDGRRCRFDPARNWALVESILSDASVNVQYIFVADFLIKRMFEHALSSGASRTALDKLRPLLRQPRGTKSHNDHYHVRIACSPQDRLEGCRDIVAGAEIVPVDDPLWQERVASLLRIVDDDQDPVRRAVAAGRLGHLRAAGAAPALLRFLQRCEDPHCLAGLRAIAALGRRPPPDLLVDVIRRSSDLDAVRSAFRLLRRQKSGVVKLLAPLLSDDRILGSSRGPYEATLAVRQEACLAVGWIGTLESGDLVAPLLNDPDPGVRAAALWALRALSAAEVFPDSVAAVPYADAPSAWKSWRLQHKDPGRNLVETMKALGYPLRRSRPDAGEARLFVKAILDVDHVSLNAQRVLNSLLKRNVWVRLEDKADPHWLWNRELSRLKRSGRGKP